jgi:hypothetical protein
LLKHGSESGRQAHRRKQPDMQGNTWARKSGREEEAATDPAKLQEESEYLILKFAHHERDAITSSLMPFDISM